MVLSKNFYSKMVIKNLNIRVALQRLNKTFLNFGARIVFMMKNTELGMPSFTM